MTFVVIVTNIPTPYRNPVYAEISSKLGQEALHVIFCAKKEPNRGWGAHQIAYSHTFLKENIIKKNDRYIHNNTDIWQLLNKFNPEVVITTGFNPTHLYAFTWAVLHHKKHISMTDGTLASEAKLSYWHRLVRRVVYTFSPAYIGASIGSMRLYSDYGITSDRQFQSHLCDNNEAFKPSELNSRPYDFMFSGRFSPEKNPIFAIEVARQVANSLGRQVTMLLLGDGPLFNEAKAYASVCSAEVAADFKCFVQPHLLPDLYCKAKIFLFPTSWDPWGVVANEACAAGQAVLVSPHAGVAGELIIHAENGYVLPLKLEVWAEHAANLLSNERLLKQYSERSITVVKNFSYANAANGILAAVSLASKKLPQNSSANLNTSLNPHKKTVVIIQRRLPDYRVPIFEQLRELLAAQNIQLRLLYGTGTTEELTKGDSVDIAWGEKLTTRYLLGGRICWQPFYTEVRGADMVIITQENKLVCNLWPLFGLRKYKLAFWGHGKNMQTLPTLWAKFKERLKFLTTNRVDWWFVYTGLSARFVTGLGFAKNKITNLENSGDTLALKSLCAKVSQDDVGSIRRKCALGDGPVALFIGSLYKEKRLDFLLTACQKISEIVPDFRLVIIGDGPQKAQIESAQTQYAWLRYVGRQTESDKARYLKTSSVILNPGLVGLGILDAFAAGVPMVTTDCELHSPEIEYLQNGVNGFMTENTIEAFAKAVVDILTDSALAGNLQKGCEDSANHYTLENMAQNFCDGILKALG